MLQNSRSRGWLSLVESTVGLLLLAIVWNELDQTAVTGRTFVPLAR